MARSESGFDLTPPNAEERARLEAGLTGGIPLDIGQRGIVEPASFIPIAEETRLILPLGEWVLRTACRQMQQWHERGAGPIRVAVNLSARQFLQHDLVTLVREVIEESGLDPSTLELEITETTAMQNADVSVEVFDQSVERKIRDIAVRQARAPGIISDERMPFDERVEPMPPDGAVPIEFQMREPVIDPDERRTPDRAAPRAPT